ncbi:MAG: hypothetical protein A2Z88_04880 [Omnitrophica WOR_2 bacterium GWA2_47_8]|nr:MAG: hypothetical protein A2Z88_04880 [Omnitrophica WOR_2 bacterium GWA2_47_8]
MKNAADQKPGFGWKSYLAFFSIVMIQQAIDFFAPNSEVTLYYRIMRAFDPTLAYMHWCNLLSVVFNLLAIAPVFLFVYRVQILKPQVWQAIILLRLVFEFTGHSFDVVCFKSVLFTAPEAAAQIAIAILIILIPSYWAGFWYAFGQDKIFSKQPLLFKN